MFVIKHFTKLSQFLAARHIKHMSRFSQVSANVSTFNTDAIVSGRSFGPGSNSLLWITLDQYQGEAEMWNIDLFCVFQNRLVYFLTSHSQKNRNSMLVYLKLWGLCVSLVWGAWQGGKYSKCYCLISYFLAVWRFIGVSF